MNNSTCKHPDIRRFDGLRYCLSCGEAVVEVISPTSPITLVRPNCAAVPYEYTKLNYERGHEIRIIILLPGSYEDALFCEITHVNLDDDPRYDAVSYTWATEDGDASRSKAILCMQGGSVPISTNCDAVLRQLRRLGKQRLCVDAICTYYSDAMHITLILMFWTRYRSTKRQ
jgi:hypothetical protein